MTRLYTLASAAVAAFALVAGASAASAQTFSNGGEAVTARGTLVQNVLNPGGPDLTTICELEVFGSVASNGSSMTFTSYQGTAISGPLACDDSLDFPIVVTALDSDTVSLSQFVVGTRNGPCFEDNYPLGYNANGEVEFDGVLFGSPAICSAEGALAVTSDVDSDPVVIL
jgi:hypothetical protein